MQELQKVRELISQLDFDECIKVYELLDVGHPIIDYIFDRMQLLDSERFDAWL